MSHYQTKQRQQILSLLQREAKRSFTAEEIALALKEEYQEDAPGKSTVYRLLPKLCEEGQIRRFETDGSHRNYYQFMEHHCHEHLHLQCTDCGKLIHMDDRASRLLLAQINAGFQFWVDGHQSVLYGRCLACRKEG